MRAGRSVDEQWELLGTTLELGSELDYVLVECASDEVRSGLARGLSQYAVNVDRPFVAPAAEAPVLPWLDAERARAAQDESVREARPIYFVPIESDESEGFVLARLNENRDNLARDMRGALCLAGLGDFLDRLPSRAPSLWAYRTKTFSFRALPSHLAGAEAPPAAKKTGLESLPVPAPAMAYDVALSAAYRDEPTAADLAQRFAADGIRCSFVPESGVDLRTGLEGVAAAANQARFVVSLLSPDYADSNAWKALESSREMLESRSRLRRRMLPILVRDCVPPAFFSGFRPLDFRSPERARQSYPNLVAAITGRAHADGREVFFGVPADVLTKPRPKLDPRLTVLAKLGLRAFGATNLE